MRLQEAKSAARVARQEQAKADQLRRQLLMEKERAEETAAQASFTARLGIVGAITRWGGGLLTILYVFESVPTLHNGVFVCFVWIKSIAETLWVALSVCLAALASMCSSHELPPPQEIAEDALLSVIVISSTRPGGSLSWRCVYRHLSEQTRHHDWVEVLFVGGGGSAETSMIASPESLPRADRLIEFRFVAVEEGAVVAEMRAAGATNARGDALLFIDANVLLPADYDESIRQSLASACNYAGTFQVSTHARTHARKG